MELKYKLEKIFNDDYPGTERFIADVIEPIFGNEIEYINDDLADREEHAEKAKNAGIKHIIYVGDLTEKNYSAQNIVLLDVILDDSKDIERSRVNIQQLIRSIIGHRQHFMIVFHYKDVTNKQWRFSYGFKGASQKDTTSAKRYTYVFGKGYRGRTAAERFEILANSLRNDEDFEKAFSVAALSDEFFDKYRAYYAAFVEFIIGEKYTDEKGLLKYLNSKEWLRWKQIDSSDQFETTFSSDGKSVRDYLKKMFGRIVFLYFLQRKGWLYDADGNPDAVYMRHLFDDAGDLKKTFLDDVLELLFFYVLNTKPEQRVQEASLAHKDITILPGWNKIPFLNGGLFSQDEIDPKRCVFPAVYFDELFRFLDSYNFTIDENDQEDAEIGIDPEMLGRIFENLLEDNKDKGAFYTPKEIVDYMCRESIIAYLQNDKFSDKGNKLIRKFIETLNIDLLDTKQRDYIEDRLLKVKICDPAIGSGAFPMGLVNLLSKIFIVLRTYKTIDQAKMKRYIMQNSIYGVDIEQGAIDIARLRFWLAMVVEENEPQPLPNLHFKIMQGNSLLESYKGHDLTHLCSGVDSTGQYSMDFNGWKQILRNDIKSFYNTDNHDKRASILNYIKNNVINQIFETTGDENFLQDVKDVSANENFFLWHTWFADVFEKGGFDIVIGNPPYLKEGRANKAIFKAVKDSPYYQGKMDIWYMFACRGIDMLKPNGNLCFIATNNWTTNAGAQKLRNKVIDDAKVLQLCDFRDYMVFESASIQTMIMLLKKLDNENRPTKYKFDYRQFIAKGSGIKGLNNMLSRIQFDKAEYLYPELDTIALRNNTFNFANTEISVILTKIEENGSFHLDNGGVLTEISSGVDVLQDYVNKKASEKLNHTHSIGEGVFVVDDIKRKEIAVLPNEINILKPYYTTEQITRYCNISSNREWLIYCGAEMNQAINSYPNIKKHLDQFTDIMTSVNKPYGLHRTRKQESFEGAKILSLRKCVGRPLFSYVETDSFVSRAFMVINTDRINLKYLTGILNSKLVAFWLRHQGKMQGLNYQIDKGPLQDIPIIISEKGIQDKIISIVEEIIDIIQNKTSPVTSHLENQIDLIVYHLYDLTYDEILIIDPQTPISREEYKSFNLDTYEQS